MPIAIDLAGKALFEVISPSAHLLPLVFNSPHSGACYPAPFLASSRLDKAAIRRSEDFCVDELMAKAVALGVPLLKANFPRAWLDVNREPYELDPKMFDGALPTYANVRSVRVAGGLGTIARIVSESEEIYAAPLDVSEALTRIELVYKPYHRTLRELVAATQADFGVALLLGFLARCRLQYAASAAACGHAIAVLGDRYGTSAGAELADIATEILTRLGYVVSLHQAVCAEVSSPSTTVSRPAASMHYRSRSTAASTWTSGRSNGPTALTGCPRTWRDWPRRWAWHSRRACHSGRTAARSGRAIRTHPPKGRKGEPPARWRGEAAQV